MRVRGREGVARGVEQAVIDDLVDFFAVDRIRQGDTHVAVAKGFSQGGFWGVPVEVIGWTAVWSGDPQFEFALFFFGA